MLHPDHPQSVPSRPHATPVRPHPGDRIHPWLYTPGGVWSWFVEILQTATNGEVLARFGAALSDPTRARVLLALREAPAYPADLADLLGVSRQSLSNHLTCLRGCGLVVAVPEGRRMRYELADERLRHALTDLLGVVLAVDEQFCRDAAHDTADDTAGVR